MSAPKVRLPFQGEHRLTQHFGERPAVYKQFGLPGHNGIDWSLPVGEAILAVDAGKVVISTEDATGFGLHIKIQHSWGQSLYAHLSQLDVALDEMVEAGQQIGLSGNSGFSSGPHLHFGMRIKPYRKDDGWYGYTNPHRFLKWRWVQKERKEPPPPPSPAPEKTDPSADAERAFIDERLRRLEQKLLETQDQLANETAGRQFERMELAQEAELWRETITLLLEKYMPGSLPQQGDELATLEKLLETWSEEIDARRSAVIAGVFAPANGAY